MLKGLTPGVTSNKVHVQSSDAALVCVCVGAMLGSPTDMHTEQGARVHKRIAWPHGMPLDRKSASSSKNGDMGAWVMMQTRATKCFKNVAGWRATLAKTDRQEKRGGKAEPKIDTPTLLDSKKGQNA